MRDVARQVDIARGSLRELRSDLATLPNSLVTDDRRAELRRRARNTDRLIAGVLSYLRGAERSDADERSA